jgi:hypothetical protein
MPPKRKAEKIEGAKVTDEDVNTILLRLDWDDQLRLGSPGALKSGLSSIANSNPNNGIKVTFEEFIEKIENDPNASGNQKTLLSVRSEDDRKVLFNYLITSEITVIFP